MKLFTTFYLLYMKLFLYIVGYHKRFHSFLYFARLGFRVLNLKCLLKPAWCSVLVLNLVLEVSAFHGG